MNMAMLDAMLASGLAHCHFNGAPPEERARMVLDASPRPPENLPAMDPLRILHDYRVAHDLDRSEADEARSHMDEIQEELNSAESRADTAEDDLEELQGHFSDIGDALGLPGKTEISDVLEAISALKKAAAPGGGE